MNIPSPQPLVELIDETRMSAGMDRLIRTLLCASFPPDIPVFSKTRFWHGTRPAFSFVRRESGRITGHVGIVVRTILVGSQSIQIAGIQNLAVSPERRKSGLGSLLMIRAMDEAHKRDIPFGLLFCVPALAQFYQTLGWETLDRSFTMADENGLPVLIPEKNIGMGLSLSGFPFPPGAIDLQGRDW